MHSREQQQQMIQPNTEVNSDDSSDSEHNDSESSSSYSDYMGMVSDSGEKAGGFEGL